MALEAIDAHRRFAYQPLTLKRSPPPEEPIGLLVAAVRHGVHRLVTRRAEPLGLSPRQFWLLIGIAERPCHSQGELAARLRADEATVCRGIRTLVSAGLVRSVRPVEDRRRVHLALTGRGEALVRRLFPIARAVRGAVDSALTREERASTRAALRKIVSNLQVVADGAGPARAAFPAGRPPPARRARYAAALP